MGITVEERREWKRAGVEKSNAAKKERNGRVRARRNQLDGERSSLVK